MIGLRCRIGKNVTIRNSIVMGNDFYQTPDEIAADKAAGSPLLGIGDGTVIDGAIIDKNCRIGRTCGSSTKAVPGERSPDEGSAMLRDGIVVVPKDTTLRNGWKL